MNYPFILLMFGISAATPSFEPCEVAEQRLQIETKKLTRLYAPKIADSTYVFGAMDQMAIRKQNARYLRAFQAKNEACGTIAAPVVVRGFLMDGKQ